MFVKKQVRFINSIAVFAVETFYLIDTKFDSIFKQLTKVIAVKKYFG